MKVKKAQARHQNKKKKKLIFFLFEIFQNLQFFFNFSNLHERSGIENQISDFYFASYDHFVLKIGQFSMNFHD